MEKDELEEILNKREEIFRNKLELERLTRIQIYNDMLRTDPYRAHEYYPY